MKHHRPLFTVLALAAMLAGCSAPSDSASPQPASSGEEPPVANAPPPASDPAPAPVESATAGFAPAPKQGDIIRANCRMGGCWWYRIDSVQAEDTMPPRYALRLTGGESTHGQDPYPTNADGIDIQWDATSANATVACSRDVPEVAYEGDARTLKLNPQGVSGVEQGIANLYFATCHGEHGDDGKLAARHGYDLK